MGTGTWDCFLFCFCFSRTRRELKAKCGGVLGREERERGPSLLLPFSFLISFSFFLSYVQFFLRNETKRNETKRNETKRNEAMRELFFFYERYGDVSEKRISDNLYIRNSTSFIDIIFNNSLLTAGYESRENCILGPASSLCRFSCLCLVRLMKNPKEEEGSLMERDQYIYLQMVL